MIAKEFNVGGFFIEEDLLEQYEANVLVDEDACVVAYVFADGSVLVCEYGQDQEVQVADTFASLEAARKEYHLVEVEDEA